MGGGGDILLLKWQTLFFIAAISFVAQVNHQNSMGRTALFHCMVRGDVDGTHKLLRAGANPTLKGSVWETRKHKRWVHVYSQ